MTLYKMAALGHTSGEIFSFGAYFDGGLTVGIDDALTAWGASVSLLYTTAGPGTHTLEFYTHTSVGIDDVTVASIDEATNKQITKRIASSAVVGTNATGTLPPQVAVAVSLRTALATKKGRGRFYLPPLAVNADSGGRILTDARDTISAGVGAMMGHMVTALLLPVVWHAGDHTHDPVTRFDVGDVFDTQRRRRNKLVEARTSTSL